MACGNARLHLASPCKFNVTARNIRLETCQPCLRDGSIHSMTGLLHRLFPLTAALLLFAPSGISQSAPPSVDLVVYGGTASGVMTAYAAAKEGLHVVLLEPGTHLGGMVTGGLSATDVAHYQIIGGYAREFYRQAAAHYGVHTLNKHDDWLSEPKVGGDLPAVAQAGRRRGSVSRALEGTRWCLKVGKDRCLHHDGRWQGMEGKDLCRLLL